MQQFVARDILMTGAMGNAGDLGSRVCYPAALNGLLVLAAIDPTLRRASFSNTRKHVFVTARGVKIRFSVPVLIAVGPIDQPYVREEISRGWQNVCNVRPSFIATDEREYRTLRVLPLDNPATPGYLHRTIHDLPAAGFDAFDGCVNGIDVEVKVPA